MAATMPLMTSRMITSIKPPTIRKPGLARFPGTAIAPPPGGIIGGGGGGANGGRPPGGGGGGGGCPTLRIISRVLPPRDTPANQKFPTPTPWETPPPPGGRKENARAPFWAQHPRR